MIILTTSPINGHVKRFMDTLLIILKRRNAYSIPYAFELWGIWPSHINIPPLNQYVLEIFK